MPTETNRQKDFTTVKALVREWLLEKGIALTGVNGEASRSTVNRFKLDLQSRIVDALNAERERCAKIAEDPANISMVGGSTGDAHGTAKRIAKAIRGGKD